MRRPTLCPRHRARYSIAHIDGSSISGTQWFRSSLRTSATGAGIGSLRSKKSPGHLQFQIPRRRVCRPPSMRGCNGGAITTSPSWPSGMLDLGQPDDKSRQDWPNLRPGRFSETSDVDRRYNCAAWAAGETTFPWWPWRSPYYWPAGVPRVETIDAFVQAYEAIGFESCGTADFEPDFEKIAIFADAQGTPTHVAKQLVTGRWSSKLGDLKDIDHMELGDLAGGLYGTPTVFMRRELSDAP